MLTLEQVKVGQSVAFDENRGFYIGGFSKVKNISYVIGIITYIHDEVIVCVKSNESTVEYVCNTADLRLHERRIKNRRKS